MRTTRRRPRRPLVRVGLAVILTPVLVAAGVVATALPAEAAACARGTGVTVVVGSDVRCAAGGGRSAASALAATGHSLTRVQRQPGFVCQVDGRPNTSCVNTPPSNAYWGLFWSDGSSGRWVYSSSGVDSLSIPRGGWVGFAFQNGSGRVTPGVTPRAAAPAPKPRPTSGPAATKPAPSASSPTRTPARTEPTKAGSSASPDSPTASASADSPETADTIETAADSGSSQSGLLGWVAGSVMVALLLTMWTVMWRRRRSS